MNESAAAVVWLGVLLAQQATVFDPVTKRTPLGLAEVLAVLAGVGALIALALRAAVRPAADPLGLPDRRRIGYVYLAELLLVLFLGRVD